MHHLQFQEKGLLYVRNVCYNSIEIFDMRYDIKEF